MRVAQDLIKQLEELYETYEQEVKDKSKEGLLTDSTARTYLLHSRNFIKWCKNDFIPGGRNSN
ncbi:hypothetical protein GI584_03435 [Gracilibacillus salitolerans]|uniref:Uncharacterized protein n=1 Tax=Gracilibacillus salitolerans TaxID=2663022 RepID=A0A5Q2TI88_9BACI|nr:hypothetical protein [Gracilibacillus salitolerans]QGH33148.1 hypothetical protein GI584_03435 [Gracilibacillus salitolerans]